MEKVVYYKVYFFKDARKGKKYYYKDKAKCNIARFCAYKTYDGERISKRGFVVPVTQVESVLVLENDMHKITFMDDLALDKERTLWLRG